MNLTGVIPPIPTPFDADAIDLPALRSNIGRWLTSRVTGVVVLGSNGEAPFVEDDEADRIIAAAREVVPRDRLLIAGSARESTRATIMATRRAADLGADLAIIRTPSFFKSQMTSDILVRHYAAVADASTIPILLYNVTVFTGINLPPEAVRGSPSTPTSWGSRNRAATSGRLPNSSTRRRQGSA